MKIIERIVESVGEPNKTDLWLKPQEGGNSTLYRNAGGQWLPIVGSGSGSSSTTPGSGSSEGSSGSGCNCDMSKIITTDDLNLVLSIDVNDLHAPEVEGATPSVAIVDSNPQKTRALLKQKLLKTVDVHIYDGDTLFRMCTTDEALSDSDGMPFVKGRFEGDGTDATSSFKVDATYYDLTDDSFISFLELMLPGAIEAGALPAGSTVQDLQDVYASMLGMSAGFTGWMVGYVADYVA